MTKPTPPTVVDQMTLEQIRSGRWDIDAEQGVIRKAKDGQRAEYPHPSGYGRVFIGRHHGRVWIAPAHRVIWLAACGPIPTGLQVNHRNGRRWDNRLANLELVTPGGNAAHWRGFDYDAMRSDGSIEGPDRPPYDDGSWMVQGGADHHRRQ